jgi:alpha-ketoglutarate-dependent taurine dioxygenase
MQPAGRGGETPIADSRRVYQLIDPRIKARFIEKQVMYVRNYGDRFDLRWQQVFQTESQAEVEQFCRRAGIECEWRERDRLRTRQRCQAVAAHPVTGEMVWFNQAHLFHVSNLETSIGAALLEEFREEELPRNAYHADGSPLEASMLDEIRRVYSTEAVSFPWKEGDILLLDNMLAAHGRTPFVGSRKMLVGMCEPFLNENI